ncbi:LysR substrate-binding domain-containing protein [Gallaecimonas mangrovi]|uniref:LysR substrate-binding domain-containing protein n=1 Tax=Gallaecimonas mangrovi TaxID=2291597 RepID=UPI000E20129D|nr:LysR substrate-binding domain-containing protein [Gallaecimonas mangrovi]
MRKITLDLEALRSFVAGVELGSFAQAALTLNRSTSAVSAHLKKLEQQLGQGLFKKAGRGLELLPAGESLLSYARHLLALNDEAVLALGQNQLEGKVRLGLQEDFGESLLTEVLARFNRAYPSVEIEVQVNRNGDLLAAMHNQQLDLALAWQQPGGHNGGELIKSFPLCWLGRPDTALTEPLPLVLFEAPCLIRQQALDALDKAGIRWRVVMTSRSLAGIWAAVQAGLGITVRTRAGVPTALKVLAGLPPLPPLALTMLTSSQAPSDAALSLKTCLLDSVHSL